MVKTKEEKEKKRRKKAHPERNDLHLINTSNNERHNHE